MQICSEPALAGEADTPFTGDIGLGIDSAPNIARSNSAHVSPVPYLNFEYGKFFARVDMFGYSLAPVGFGSLELVTRVLNDAYTPTSAFGDLARRKSPIPLGLGTLQITPVGAVLLNVYHDVGQSGGNLADLLFAEEIDLPGTAIYPQIGAEYRSRDYVRYFYGVSNAEAAQIRTRSYQPGAATNLFVDLLVEQKILGNWYLNANIRKTLFASPVTDSPLVEPRTNVTGLVALSYRFQ
ncbi:outer membrane protein [Oxalobacteraceae bacterium GrIS 2.11]